MKLLLLKSFLLFTSLSLLPFHGNGQQLPSVIEGFITDSLAQSIEYAFVQLEGQAKATFTNERGYYTLSLQQPCPCVLTINHLEYQPERHEFHLQAGDTLFQNFILKPQLRLLEQVIIRAENREDVRRQAGLTRLDPHAAKAIPSPFGDFTRILATLPGVTSNNELSSSYSVRGGNFDENLVYVNDIPVYRPFLVSAGQQEGLSFINADLVEDVMFSAGGWQPKYGDKLSSSLNVTYKKPKETSASLTASLLGGAAHLEGSTEDDKITYLAGVRIKSAQYLLNTLEVDGQYLPRFIDLQSYMTADLDGNPQQTKTEIGLLTAYANNSYLVRPTNRVTNFGTLDQPFRLEIKYKGQEILSYQTFQQGFHLSHRISQRWNSKVIGSWVTTQEREYYDLEGKYELAEANFNPETGRQEEDITLLGEGKNYSHARNKLKANLFHAESRTAFAAGDFNTLEFGIGGNIERIDDQIQEYDFTDSSEFVTINNRIYNNLSLHSHRLFGFIQHRYEPSEKHTLLYGVRLNYWSFSQQWLISPRLQYAWKPSGDRDIIFRMATGLYQQPPFYRELRNREGQINETVKAQSSFHMIAGMDYRFVMFGRPFTFVSEFYHKHLSNVIPYEIDNVRIRYFAQNNAIAYATGVDFRINGEFIEGAESWFSLGILNTREDIQADERGYIRRPSDQLINLGIFFQDYLPNDPTLRVYLSLLYGSGLPYGPPDEPRYRNEFKGSDYKRVDIGFSKQIFFSQKEEEKPNALRSLWMGLEILNLLGADNTISYTWVTDTNNNQYAVPNSLSARYLNFKVIVRY